MLSSSRRFSLTLGMFRNSGCIVSRLFISIELIVDLMVPIEILLHLNVNVIMKTSHVNLIFIIYCLTVAAGYTYEIDKKKLTKTYWNYITEGKCY